MTEGSCHDEHSPVVLQLLLAAVYVAHGWILLFPPADLAEQINASMPTAYVSSWEWRR